MSCSSPPSAHLLVLGIQPRLGPHHISTNGEQVFTQRRASCLRWVASMLCSTFGQSRLLSCDESDDSPNNEGKASVLVRWLNSAPTPSWPPAFANHNNRALCTYYVCCSCHLIIAGDKLLRRPCRDSRYVLLGLVCFDTVISQKLGTSETLCL